MASVKLILRKKKKADGTYPLALRITKNRKSSIVTLDYSILSKQWNEKSGTVKSSHPNSKQLNNYLIKKLSEALNGALETESATPIVTVRAVKEKVKPSIGSTFFIQAEDHLNDLKNAGKYNQYTADKPRISHFKKYLHNQDIAFQDITVGVLEKFKTYLKSSYRSENGKRLKPRSIENHQ